MVLKRYPVAESMHKDVETVAPDATLYDAVRAVAASRYSCLVVVDAARHPIGMLTSGDLFRLVFSEQVPGGSHLRHILASPEAMIEHVRSVHAAAGDRVDACMTSPVVTLDDTATLDDAAELLDAHDMHQLPIVHGGRLVGLIRRVDLLEPLVRAHIELQQEHAEEAKAQAEL